VSGLRWTIDQLNPKLRAQVQKKLDHVRATAKGERTNVCMGPESKLFGATSSKPGPRKKGSHALIPRISKPEERLAFHLRADGIDHFEREYKFWPERKFRADFAFLAERVLVEVDGGLHEGGGKKRGRHTRARGFERDCVKRNEAQITGWLMLNFSPAMVASGHAVHTIKRALEARAPRGGEGARNVEEEEGCGDPGQRRAGCRDTEGSPEAGIAREVDVVV
jgi:very-short-patch-repair endonuclease